MTTAELATVREFLDRFAAALEGEGVPRGAGRMLALLFVEGTPQTAADLAAKLAMSRSNVSATVRALEALGLVERRRRRGERHDHFRLPPEPFVPMLHAGVARAGRLRALVADCRGALPPEAAGPASRLADLEAFFGFSADWLAAMSVDWVTGRRRPG